MSCPILPLCRMRRITASGILVSTIRPRIWNRSQSTNTKSPTAPSDSPRRSGTAAADAHTPELRDRVFDQAAARRAEALAAAAADSAIEQAIADVAASPPGSVPEATARVRTAPVRGYLPPVEA